MGRVSALPGVRVEHHPSLRALYLWMRSSGPKAGPFSDAKVRRAVSLAIDRDVLAARFAAGNSPLWGFVPTVVYGAVPGPGLAADPALARRLLAEAGHADGVESRLTHAPGGDHLAAAVGEMLAPVGIRATPELVEWPVMRDRWQAGELSMFLGSWRFDSNEASLFLRECIHTHDRRADKSWNPGFSSPRLDRMIEDNFRLFGDTTRMAHFGKLWEAMTDEMPVVPLLERLDLYAVRSRIRWTPRGDGSIRVAEMTVAGR